MAMEYFCCFHAYRKKLESLSDSEKGRLWDALMIYSETGERAKLNGREAIAFDFIAADIDAAKEKYNQKCRTNRENGGKRTVANGSERLQTIANRSETSQTKNKNITPLTPQGELFGRFWSAYPKKVGKANCERWFARHKVDEETLKAMLDSLAYLKTTEQWQKDGGQYIPNPQTWLNGRRWEDESAKPPQREKVTYIGKL